MTEKYTVDLITSLVWEAELLFHPDKELLDEFIEWLEDAPVEILQDSNGGSLWGDFMIETQGSERILEFLSDQFLEILND